jgi:hypothetical protein
MQVGEIHFLKKFISFSKINICFENFDINSFPSLCGLTLLTTESWEINKTKRWDRLG